MAGLTAKQEAFAQTVVLNGGDKVKAYKKAGYSTRGSSKTISNQAHKLYTRPDISRRIKELQQIADKKAHEVFSISVETRLRWLQNVAIAGLETYKTEYTERRENLTATVSAVKEMNEMLGVDEAGTKKEPLIIEFVRAKKIETNPTH